MKVYDINSFNSSLATKPYCSNDLSFGIIIRPKDQAIKYKYIQNKDRYIKFLVVDVDHSNPLIWEESGLPAPNFLIRDRITNRSHIVWVLDWPIYRDYKDQSKALNYFAKIEQAYTAACKGDLSYVGLIMKNPNHDNWITTQFNYYRTYSLNELAEYVELPKQITKREAIGEGRNCWLFDTVRKFAYKEVLFYKKNGASLSDFYNVILNRLDKSNVFEKSIPLNFNELKAIAKSISKWTWQHFSEEEFSKIQSIRGRKSASKRQKIGLILKESLKNEFS